MSLLFVVVVFVRLMLLWLISSLSPITITTTITVSMSRRASLFSPFFYSFVSLFCVVVCVCARRTDLNPG